MPIDPTQAINGASKLGGAVYISVLIVLILAALVFFLLRSMVRQNQEAVADRVRAVDGFVAYVDRKSKEDFERQERFVDLHLNTVKAMDRVSETLGKLCGDSEANQTANASAMSAIGTAMEAGQKANATAMAAITASNETNQRSVISAIDILQREHRACLEATSLVCSNFGLGKAKRGDMSGSVRGIRRKRVAEGAGG